MKISKETFDNIVHFHGDISWYTLDCYPEEIQKKLEKLPISTYSVRIGNHKCHYFSWELPRVKSFGYGQKDFDGNAIEMNGEPQPSEKFMKELRAYIRKSRYFNKSKITIGKAKALAKKSI